MTQTAHLISSISSRAKKEIRSKGGIHSHEKIYLTASNPVSSFALRIFVSELFSGRRDIIFVRKETDATLILDDKTLDDTAEELLVSVLDGTVSSHLSSPEIRTVHPFSGIPAEEISAYAKIFGWNTEMSEPAVSTVHEFLNDFSMERPSAKYALKNISDKLHEKADILSLQIHNQENT